MNGCHTETTCNQEKKQCIHQMKYPILIYQHNPKSSTILSAWCKLHCPEKSGAKGSDCRFEPSFFMVLAQGRTKQKGQAAIDEYQDGPERTADPVHSDQQARGDY